MNKENEHITHARSMKADILAAPSIWLPRREILLDWLTEFVQRGKGPSTDADSTEIADLTALDLFLRKKKVTSAATAAA